ncbi:MAG TPA: hypothetical protein VHC67_08780 [Gaiellaceae bacterium]|jgi:LSD1 subclass zinc finger protein|nr:hypothetical protein [Gaiellaceae bacterium]
MATEDPKPSPRGTETAAPRAAVYIACPVCREPVELPRGELPKQIVCESCGAVLER